MQSVSGYRNRRRRRGARAAAAPKCAGVVRSQPQAHRPDATGTPAVARPPAGLQRR